MNRQEYINIENMGVRFGEIVHSEEWKELQNKYNECDDIYVLGHGGNMGVADHTAVDMTRLSNGTKNAMCPGSCVVATSYINDTDFDHWMMDWLKARTSTRTKSQIKKGFNVAMVFDSKTDLLNKYNGIKVIDGDETDLRTKENDGINVIVGLRAKMSKANIQKELLKNNSFIVKQ